MNSSSEEEVLDSEDEAYKRHISVAQVRAERSQNNEQGQTSTAPSRPPRTVRFAMDMDWDPPSRAESTNTGAHEEVEDVVYGIRDDTDESDHRPVTPPDPGRSRNGLSARKSALGIQRGLSSRAPPPRPQSTPHRPPAHPIPSGLHRRMPTGNIPNQGRRIEENTFRRTFNHDLPPRPSSHFQQPLNQSPFYRRPGAMPQNGSLPNRPKFWQPRKPVRPPQDIKVLDNSSLVAERTSERRQLHFLHRPITAKSARLARRSFIDTEEQINRVLEPLLANLDSRLGSDSSEERQQDSPRTLWPERTERRGARKTARHMVTTPPDDSPAFEDNQIENQVIEPMDLFDEPSVQDQVRESTPPIATTKRAVTAVKVPSYAQRQLNHPPPNNLLTALEQVTLLQPTKLPFLRRNLKPGFLHAFVRHCGDRDRSIPKVPATPNKHPINVRWMYTLREEHPASGLQSISWASIQDSWRCQLCNAFHPFKMGNLLLFHLRRDHNEVVTRLRKLSPGNWLLQVELSNTEIADNDSAGGRSSSSPSPLLIRGPTPFIAPPRVKSETEDDTSRAFTTTPEQDFDTPAPPIPTNRDVPPVYRPGGMGVYDVARREMPLPFKGLIAQAWLAHEEDMIFYSVSTDQDKAMVILWGRWIAQYRLCFVEDPTSNVKDFIRQYADLIDRTAGKHAFILWLLTLKFHRHLTQDQVEELSVYYRSCIS